MSPVTNAVSLCPHHGINWQAQMHGVCINLEVYLGLL